MTSVRADADRRVLFINRINVLAMVLCVTALVCPTRTFITVPVGALRTIRRQHVFWTQIGRTITGFSRIARPDGRAAHRARGRDGTRRDVATRILCRTLRASLQSTTVSVATRIVVRRAIFVQAIAVLSRLDDAVAAH